MPRGNRDDALPDNWNPMKEEYEGSASDYLQYDKLYVTNIPLKLNQDGVENAFKAYGSVRSAFLNADHQRRYAMVQFADTRDAERAIHGLHMKQPLNLNVEYAKKKEWHQQRKKDSGPGKQRNSRAGRDEKPVQNSSWSAAADERRRQEPADRGSSGGRRSNGVGSDRQDRVANNSFSNDNDEDLGEYFPDDETYGLEDLELMADGEEGLPNPEACVNLLLEEYVETKMQLVRMQMRDRLGLNIPSGRKSLPAGLSKGCFMTSDGRIVRQVSALPNTGPRLPRRASDRQVNVVELEEDDVEKVPELREHVCVRCGRRGEMQCGACGTTYCSAICQRKDWTTRHASVCHNLANSTANLTRAGARGAFQQPRQPRKSAAASPEVPEQVINSVSNDGHNRQGPKRFDSSNMHAIRKQLNDDGKKQWRTRQNSNNRRGDNNAKTSGGTTSKYQQHRNDNANFYSSDNSKANGTDMDSKLNPVPIRRPREKSVQYDNEDWDKNQGRQLDSPKANEIKPRDVKKVSSAPTRMPIKKNMKEPVKDNAQPVKKTEKEDLLRPDGFVALHASPGTVLTLGVEADAATCDVDASYGQGVCVAVTEQFAAQFEALCGDEFVKACEGSEVCSATPGSYVVLRDALDGGWYRARVLTENRVALVDAARIAVVSLEEASTIRRLPESYLRVPEFSCVIGAGDGVNLKVGESYEYVVSNISNGVCSGILRSLVHAGGEDLGPVNLCRWRCKAEDELEKVKLEKVELAPVQAETPPKPTRAKETVTEAKANTTQAKETAPADSVDVILARPPVANESKVLLVEYVDSSRVFVRRADEELKLDFDALVQDVAVYGLDAAPLTEPQPVGAVVIAQFTDGNYYRAIIRKRNRLEQRKYMLEYVEYGNTEISTLDMLRVCPKELSLETRPALLSRVSLADVASDETGKAVKFNEECSAYLGELKDKEVELVLTLKDATSKGSVGCEVLLCVERSKERVNEKLRRILMPQWEVMEAKGEDIIESPVLMWSDMKVARLPKGPCRLQVLDASTLHAGSFSACSADENWHHVVTELSEELEKYTSSKVGSDPYLPRQHELCVAKSADGVWYRAACVEHPGGAGASHITVLHVDSGHVESVAVEDVRKMLPETAKRRPAMAAYCAIEGYPEEPSEELIARTRVLLSTAETSPTGGIVDCSDANATSEGEYSLVLPTVMATLTAEGLLK